MQGLLSCSATSSSVFVDIASMSTALAGPRHTCKFFLSFLEREILKQRATPWMAGFGALLMQVSRETVPRTRQSPQPENARRKKKKQEKKKNLTVSSLLFFFFFFLFSFLAVLVVPPTLSLTLFFIFFFFFRFFSQNRVFSLRTPF